MCGNIDPGVAATLAAQVARLIVGTHHNRFIPKSLGINTSAANVSSHYVHEALLELLLRRGWRIVWQVPMSDKTRCVQRYLRGNYATPPSPDRFDWAAMLGNPGCTHSTPRGPVAHWDGEIIADNPRFVDVAKGFSLADEQLVVDDLVK